MLSHTSANSVIQFEQRVGRYERPHNRGHFNTTYLQGELEVFDGVSMRQECLVESDASGGPSRSGLGDVNGGLKLRLVGADDQDSASVQRSSRDAYREYDEWSVEGIMLSKACLPLGDGRLLGSLWAEWVIAVCSSETTPITTRKVRGIQGHSFDPMESRKPAVA